MLVFILGQALVSLVIARVFASLVPFTRERAAYWLKQAELLCQAYGGGPDAYPAARCHRGYLALHRALFRMPVIYACWWLDRPPQQILDELRYAIVPTLVERFERWLFRREVVLHLSTYYQPPTRPRAPAEKKPKRRSAAARLQQAQQADQLTTTSLTTP